VCVCVCLCVWGCVCLCVCVCVCVGARARAQPHPISISDHHGARVHVFTYARTHARPHACKTRGARARAACDTTSINRRVRTPINVIHQARSINYTESIFNSNKQYIYIYYTSTTQYQLYRNPTSTAYAGSFASAGHTWGGGGEGVVDGGGGGAGGVSAVRQQATGAGLPADGAISRQNRAAARHSSSLRDHA